MTDSELRLECYRLASPRGYDDQLAAGKELYSWCVSSHELTVSQEDFDALVRGLGEKAVWESKRERRLRWGTIVVKPAISNNMAMVVE